MSSYSNAEDVVHDIISLEEKKSTIVCCMLWSWWLRRNKLNAREKACTEENLRGQILYWSQECDTYCSKADKNPSQKELTQWSPPPYGRLKINVDGSYQQDSGQGGWGFVIRDDTGQVWGAGAGHLKSLASAGQAEAHACLEAVQAAARWGMDHVQVESDSQILVNAMKGPEFDRALEGVLYKEIRSFISLNFLSASFSFCPRTCNKISHAMAALGTSQTESHLFWQESIPNSVSVLVASEYAELI
jgi:hypothetical protein